MRVEGGRSEEECRRVAYAIAHSPLVKTAFFASDPNLGRILAAIGYSGVPLDTAKVDLYIDEVLVAKGGGRNPAYREEQGAAVMKKAEFTGARGAQPRQSRGDGVDLRPVLRLRENQRRVPKLEQRTRKDPASAWTQLLPPPPPSRRDWKASIAFAGAARAPRARRAGCSRCATCTASSFPTCAASTARSQRVEQNTRQFVEGKPANNVLLTGARGTGKSSIVKGLLNKYSKQGLRLIEVEKNDLVDLPDIVDQVAPRQERFLLFCDDLTFHGAEEGYIALKVALDGSISTTSENLLIYATSNRRHLMPEYMSENLETKYVGDEIHPGETVEEKISLSERFGLWVSFYPFDQDEYLEIVGPLAASRSAVPLREKTTEEALQWALQRGSRSGRVAYQFARDWAGRHAKKSK